MSEMRQITYRDAVREAMCEEMRRDENVYFMGEDIGAYTAEVAEVSDSLKAELAQEIKSGLTIRPVKGIQAGFRLAANDGSGYFDCSDDEVMEMLMPFFRNLDI